ncbi:MAG TPA: hypothetical protein VGZ00_12540 [Candidatus Baltobacteraceae bacterium]|jgi:hypothetical protein|nr:hypothetical protein [Candidatus Baltobacteraceae bacterium]
MLNLHFIGGLLVLLCAAAAIFVPIARRVVVFVLIAQVLLGIALAITTHLVPPVFHWVLALLTGGLYPLANRIERREPGSLVARGIALVAALIFTGVFALGMYGLHGGAAPLPLMGTK